MKTRRIAAAVLLAFLPSTIALPAVAQTEDAVTTQARARFKEGVDYYDKGQYENARLAFLQAYALKKHPAVLLNLAQSSAKAGHALEASKYFQQFLKEASTATPQQKQDAAKGLEEVRQKLGRIEIAAPAGTEVTLDDKDQLGAAPFVEPVDVEPGAHTLKTASGETAQVNVAAGQKVQARLGGAGNAAASPVAAPTPSGSENPTAQPENQPTEVPGALTGSAAPEPTKHTNLLSPPETMAPVYIGLAAAGVGLVGAIVFAAFKSDAQSKADSVANEIRSAAQSRGLDPSGICSSTSPAIQQDFGSACQTLKDNNDKVDTNATVANVSLVVMGVGLVTAGAWYLFAPKRGEGSGSAKNKTIVTPYAGWRSGGLSISGTF